VPPRAFRSIWSNLFKFCGYFLNQLNQQVVEMAAKYAIASKAKHVEVTGYSANVLLDNGQTLSEADALADERARDVIRAMESLGLAPRVIKCNPSNHVATAHGTHDWQNRKVTVSVSGVSAK
jgi:outer membrane protein OmpA-like peptidoglycan-associated protein